MKQNLVSRTFINSYIEVFYPEENHSEPEPAWVNKEDFDSYVHDFGRRNGFGIANKFKCISRCKLTNEELVEMSMGDNYPLCFEYCRITTCYYNRHSKHYTDLLEDSYESEREAYYV